MFVNFLHDMARYQFKLEPGRHIFLRNFSWQYIFIARVFAKNLLTGSCQSNIFVIFPSVGNLWSGVWTMTSRDLPTILYCSQINRFYFITIYSIISFWFSVPHMCKVKWGSFLHLFESNFYFFSFVNCQPSLTTWVLLHKDGSTICKDFRIFLLEAIFSVIPVSHPVLSQSYQLFA